MAKFLTYFFIFSPIVFFGQYPFEKFKSPKYTTLKITKFDNGNTIKYSAKKTSFFNDKSDLEISLNGNYENWKDTHKHIKSNSKSKKYSEEILVQGIEGFYVADFNGDEKKDIKIVCAYMGNGLASLNVRIMYFYQKENKEFTKIAFDDKIDGNRLERDINNDGKFEIITMTLQNHKNHNYWLFNVYNFENDSLICVNKNINYPIMIPFLFRNNFKISTKITREEMLKYELKLPESFSISK